MLPICLMLAVTFAEPTLKNVTEFENRVGCKINHISFYTDSLVLDKSRLLSFTQRGIIPTIYYQPQMTYPEINSGKFDADFVKFAATLKTTNNVNYVSIAPEIADWQRYGFSKVNTIEQYRVAFNRVANIIKYISPKTKILWTVNVRFEGDYGEYSSYYPGDNRVDVVTLTGFDFYKTNSWNEPRTFHQIFKRSYDEITLLTQKDVIVSETSTAGSGFYKKQWLQDAFSSTCKFFPRIKRITLFNILEARKYSWTADWRVDPLNLKGIFSRSGDPCKR